MQTKNWEETLQKFRKHAVKSDSMIDLGEKVKIDRQVIKKILNGHEPNAFHRLKIEEWIKVQEK